MYDTFGVIRLQQVDWILAKAKQRNMYLRFVNRTSRNRKRRKPKIEVNITNRFGKEQVVLIGTTRRSVFPTAAGVPS